MPKSSIRFLLKKYKLTMTVLFSLVALSLYHLVRLIQGEDYASNFFYVSTSSIIFFSMVFVGTSVTLLCKFYMWDLDVFIISLCTTLSLIWTYELIYHYSFPVYLNYYRFPFFFTDLRSLILMGSLSLLILVGRRHIKIKGNYLLLISTSLFILTYGLWLIIGFPNPDGNLYWPLLLKVNNPFALGVILNRLSKLLLSISWILLYAGH